MSHPFAQTNVGASKQKVHPGSGACQSEKQEFKLARSLCDSGSIADSRAPIIRKSRGKTTTLYKYELSSTKRGIIPWPVKCSSMLDAPPQAGQAQSRDGGQPLTAGHIAALMVGSAPRPVGCVLGVRPLTPHQRQEAIQRQR